MSIEPSLAILRKRLAQAAKRDICNIIVEGIQRSIAGKDFAPGEALPGERELCAKLGVSRNVVRRAISLLEADGSLVTRHGLGTFVPKELRKSTNSALGFTEEMSKRGHSVGNRISFLARRVPTSQEALELGLAPNETIIELVRVRLADDVPVAHERSIMPEQSVSSKYDGSSSLYAEMETHGSRPQRVLQEIGAAAAEGDVAVSLDIGVGSPVLKIIRKGFDDLNRVTELTTSHFRSDRYTWMTELRR